MKELRAFLAGLILVVLISLPVWAFERKVADFEVGTTPPGQGQYPALATDWAGNFIVVWQSLRSNTDIYWRRYNFPWPRRPG